MDLAVVICSRNGQRMLADVIAAAKTSLDAAGGGRLLLIDSASTDSTAEVMRGVADAEVITLERPGQSRARNAAFAAANGSAVLFTDDDVLVPTNWVRALSLPLSG